MIMKGIFTYDRWGMLQRFVGKFVEICIHVQQVCNKKLLELCVSKLTTLQFHQFFPQIQPDLVVVIYFRIVFHVLRLAGDLIMLLGSGEDLSVIAWNLKEVLLEKKTWLPPFPFWKSSPFEIHENFSISADCWLFFSIKKTMDFLG